MPKPNVERNTKVVKLWNDNRLTMELIGERFGVTRNAVAGVLDRARKIGLPVRELGPTYKNHRKAKANG